MRRSIVWLGLAAAIVGVANHAGAGVITTTINTGNGFRSSVNILFDGTPRTESGGSIGYLGGSSVGGESVPFLYCVDIFRDINVPGFYNAQVSDNGTVYGGSLLANPGQIAWLVVHEAPTATTSDQQLALQAAIWKQVYGSHFQLSNSNNAGLISAYNTYITDLGSNTAPLSSVEWISPYTGNYNWLQAQVTADPSPPAAPEPGSLIVWGVGAVGLAGRAWRKRRLAA